jgi:hypothetical protein
MVGLTPGMTKGDCEKAIAVYLDRLIAGTRLADLGARLGLFDRPATEIAASTDSFVELALALHPLHQQNHEAEERRAGAASRLRPRYAKALLEKAGGLVSPDANSTLRVTFGQVKPLPAARDGVDYRAFTTLEGIEQKHTGQSEFDAPDAQLSAVKDLHEGRKPSPFMAPELRDVPVDFLSTVDITGGNSGSPTLNARGEFVGLVFDGTYDTVASDFVFDPVRTRAIHADVRYMLWVISEVEGATHLLQEMGIQ